MSDDDWTTRLLAPQPDPRPGGRSVTLHAVERARDPRVRALLMARRGQGIARYGVELTADNGRDAQLDALQEAVDLLVYLRQAELEGDGQAGTDAMLVEGMIGRLLGRVEAELVRLLARAGWR